MDHYLLPQPLTDNLRPVYARGEIELSIVEPVSLYHGDEKVAREGTLALSTHRVIWTQAEKKHAVCLHLGLIKTVEAQAGFIGFSSPKLVVYLLPRPMPPPGSSGDFFVYHSLLIRKDQNNVPRIQPPFPNYIKFSFQGEGQQHMYNHIQQALNSKQWMNSIFSDSLTANTQQQTAASSSTSSASFSTSSAGISGIIRAQDVVARRTDRALDAAFTDLTTLMTHAKEIVTLAEQFSRSRAYRQVNNTLDNTEAQQQQGKEDAEFLQLLTSMGIPNPVTRLAAGSAYHRQLSRELSDFLLHHPTFLRDSFMTLTDIYCVYNRARGIELISPEDCVQACDLFISINSVLRMKTFASGVKVVCHGEVWSDEHAIATVLSAIIEAGCLSSLGLSVVLHVPLVLMEQRCIIAEQRGLIVRDESIEGVKWYENKFNLWAR